MILDRIQKRKIDSKKYNKGRQKNNIELNKMKRTNKGGNIEEERKTKDRYHLILRIKALVPIDGNLICGSNF